MTIHHIGYLVKKLERARTAFEALGYGVERETVRDEFRKVDIVFLVKDGYRVELVSPYDPSSVVAGLLARTGNAPYHVCYEVDDLDAEVERLRDAVRDAGRPRARARLRRRARGVSRPPVPGHG